MARNEDCLWREIFAYLENHENMGKYRKSEIFVGFNLVEHEIMVGRNSINN